MLDYYDVLIIGNGIAGSSTALFLAEAGKRVLLLTKGEGLEETNTAKAQGGIVFRGEDDCPSLLFKDIMEASAFTAYSPSARLISRLGPPLVQKLLIDRLQVPFDRKNGKWDLFQEGNHSLRRILHVKDYTGKVIQEALNQAVLCQPLIEVSKNSLVVDLIISSRDTFQPDTRYLPLECLGAYIWKGETKEIIPVLASTTVLATGGLSEIYRYSSGGTWNTGGGFAIAQRAGARLSNMEYVQFHPTLLYTPQYSSSFLISESARGEGAELLNAEGKPFMSQYHPRGSLAPRDVVARAIFQEMKSYQSNCVYLDFRAKMTPDKIKDTFPSIYEELLRRGIDITQEPAPVAPGAHFSCGGVLTDTWGRTSIKRLYAAGEVACSGLHGANRLASTSLLEGLTFGYRVAKDITKYREKLPTFTIFPWRGKIGDPPPESIVRSSKEAIKTNMWENVGLIREKRGLLQSLQILTAFKKEIAYLQESYGISPALIELQNIAETAFLVTEEALKNPLSRGTHFRLDAFNP
ncbi:MAG: FAD-dependent oxidoreductase [Candidatus Atribacteria bacterium]|nr:FAD-dependent oxidoreductase [Candidatus Atribacteria bacterium]